jgi:REP element-mobilizing transposase RayT
LPEVTTLKLNKIQQSLEALDPHSEEFLKLQQRYFLTTEQYLDNGAGFAPFNEARPCQQCLNALTEMETEGWRVGEATIMPNHVHLLILRQHSDFSLQQIIKRFKGRSSRWINQDLARSDRFWQADWVDRWIRHEIERKEVIGYMRNNPVQAKLVSKWSDYPWRVSNEHTP